MPAKCVLIVNPASVLTAGLELLLHQQRDFKVVSSNPENEEKLIEEIGRHRPDIVLLDDSQSLVEPLHLIASLKDCPNLRVIVVNLKDNRLLIFNRQEFEVACANDLVDAVRRP